MDYLVALFEALMCTFGIGIPVFLLTWNIREIIKKGWHDDGR